MTDEFHARNYHEAAHRVEGTSHKGDGMRVIQHVGYNLWRIAEVFMDDFQPDESTISLSERWENIKENWGLK